jgi:hypothetical protein
MLVCAAIKPAVRRDRERDAVIDYLRKGFSVCAAPMNFVPVRILVVLIGIVLFDSNVSFVCVHLAMYVLVDGGQHNLGLLCDVLHWAFRGYFVLIFFAKRIPRVAVVALLGLTCLFYGCFWWGPSSILTTSSTPAILSTMTCLF